MATINVLKIGDERVLISGKLEIYFRNGNLNVVITDTTSEEYKKLERACEDSTAFNCQYIPELSTASFKMPLTDIEAYFRYEGSVEINEGD